VSQMGTGAIQVQYRRGPLALMQTFVGAAGEVTVDLNGKRPALHDGVTLGGFPMHRSGFTPVADASYQALTTDVFVVFTSLSAARTITLPALQNYPEGQRLTIVDGTQTSSAHTVTITTASTAETIVGPAGAASTSIALSLNSSASLCAKQTLLASHGSTAFTTSTGGAVSSDSARWIRL
jgi:hypothetical protein